MTTHELLLAAKAAAPALAWLGSEEKNAAILRMADAIVRETDVILAANEADVQAAKGTISDVMLDRLRLTQARIAAMADGMRQVSALPDPVGEVLAEVRRPNGLVIRKTAVPLGVVAIIYESRPNVTSDADEAIRHIAAHSTHHSDAIVTENVQTAERFTRLVDSAAVYVNASTRFTDGGEFGLGCEMGISTQKLHARGPMGLRELTTYKYIVTGDGQTR